MKQIYLAALLLFLNTGTAQCITPSISDIIGSATVCAGNSSSLGVSCECSNIAWFNAETGGLQLGVNNPFVTGPLFTTTSFWAEAQNFVLGEPVTGGGKVTPTSTGGTTVVEVTSPWGLAFTANESFILDKVDVFLSSSIPGNVIIQLKNESYGTIQELIKPVPAGGTNSNPVQMSLTLNLIINAGSSYKLVVASGPAMIRDLGTNTFPYPIGSVGSITGGTINDSDTNPNVYYFLYNWAFTPITICTSERMEFVVEVIDTPAPIADANQTFVAGETVSDLEVTAENISWFANAAGTIPMSPDTPLADGETYYLNQSINGCPGPIISITVTQTLGVSDVELRKLAYYPNPVSNTLFISNDYPINRIEVYNLCGQLVFERMPDSVNTEIDFSSLTIGCYIAKISSGEVSRNIRIIKQ